MIEKLGAFYAKRGGNLGRSALESELKVENMQHFVRQHKNCVKE